MSKLELLLKRIQKPEEPKPKKLLAAGPSKQLFMLLNRVNTREWLPQAEEDLMLEIRHLRYEVKWIEHMRHCWMCQIEVELDVERYLGKHIAWFVNLESGEYMEREDQLP